MLRYLLIIATVFTLVFFVQFRYPAPDTPEVTKETPVWQVLEYLGESPTHKIDPAVQGVSAERGEELVLKGFTKALSGRKTKRQSKHFVCTSCHNIEREDPDVSKVDPQARLEFARDNGLPYLQATSLYGAVNRSSFYNGDYEKKYGELVIPARNDIREAIQLCAVECAQGRKLAGWEVESILSYLWGLQFKLDDLPLTDADMQKIKKAVDQKDQSAVAWLKTKFLQGAPATFAKPPEDRKTGYGLVGNVENGKMIFDLSCMHCHEKKRYSFFELDDDRLTFKYLDHHFSRYSHSSVYQVTRYGVQSLYGKPSYMPQYTLEKMTNQQLEDLRAYIKSEAQ